MGLRTTPSISKARQKAWEADQAEKKKHAQFARMAQQWVTISEFGTSAECIAALRVRVRRVRVRVRVRVRMYVSFTSL